LHNALKQLKLGFWKQYIIWFSGLELKHWFCFANSDRERRIWIL